MDPRQEFYELLKTTAPNYYSDGWSDAFRDTKIYWKHCKGNFPDFIRCAFLLVHSPASGNRIPMDVRSEFNRQMYASLVQCVAKFPKVKGYRELEEHFRPLRNGGEVKMEITMEPA